MYCQCYICGIQYRIKPPFEDDSVTHGLCDPCFNVEIKRLEKWSAARKKARYVVLPTPK
jgi:hypothetical protein